MKRIRPSSTKRREDPRSGGTDYYYLENSDLAHGSPVCLLGVDSGRRRCPCVLRQFRPFHSKPPLVSSTHIAGDAPLPQSACRNVPRARQGAFTGAAETAKHGARRPTPQPPFTPSYFHSHPHYTTVICDLRATHGPAHIRHSVLRGLYFLYAYWLLWWHFTSYNFL